MLEQLKECKLCPHQCKVNRLEGKRGRCHAGSKLEVALISIHPYEEPCISGTKGSGTIFFSNCNFNCVFCQNYEISQEHFGREMEIEELAEKMINLQEKGVHNINLVTPVMYVYHIIESIKIAKKNGLHIPILYNSNGYETLETLKELEDYIDVYLPDFKYYNNEIAKRYSNIDHYFEITTKALKEMERQVGGPVFNEEGMIQRGLIVRHLILPNYIENSKHILKWMKENLSEDVYISVMAQYFPTYKAKEEEKLNRKITGKEYKTIERYLYMQNITNGYMQDLGKHEQEYVPDFKGKQRGW